MWVLFAEELPIATSKLPELANILTPEIRILVMAAEGGAGKGLATCNDVTLLYRKLVVSEVNGGLPARNCPSSKSCLDVQRQLKRIAVHWLLAPRVSRN